jgi:hypothetical protein
MIASLRRAQIAVDRVWIADVIGLRGRCSRCFSNEADRKERSTRAGGVVLRYLVVRAKDLPTLRGPVCNRHEIPQAFTLAVFERIEGADYARSWLVAATGWAAARQESRSGTPGLIEQALRACVAVRRYAATPRAPC